MIADIDFSKVSVGRSISQEIEFLEDDIFFDSFDFFDTAIYYSYRVKFVFRRDKKVEKVNDKSNSKKV